MTLLFLNRTVIALKAVWGSMGNSQGESEVVLLGIVIIVILFGASFISLAQCGGVEDVIY